ncbi:tetratricopeptide repeat protein, partial [Phaeovulum sp.]
LARASGDPAAALAMLRAAVAGDTESWRKALALGRAEARAGNTTAAETELRRAQALAPGSQEPLAALLALVAAEQGGAAALDAAERAALAAPRSRFHWQLASDAARDAGQPARALAHARRALCLAPDLAAVHQMLASLHGAAAEGKMAAFRSLASTRLQASAARHRAR